MNTYHKIHNVFKRDHNTGKPILGEYSLPEFELLKDIDWVFTEKVDGTNIRIVVNVDGFSSWEDCVSIKGKTEASVLPVDLLSALKNQFLPLGEVLHAKFPDGACLYGEGYGPKIQAGGSNYSSTPKFVMFDIKVGKWWLKREDVEVIGKEFGIDIVPIVGEGTLQNGIDMVKSEMKSQWGDFFAEGVIAVPKVSLYARNGERIITKIKCRDFIL